MIEYVTILNWEFLLVNESGNNNHDNVNRIQTADNTNNVE